MIKKSLLMLFIVFLLSGIKMVDGSSSFTSKFTNMFNFNKGSAPKISSPQISAPQVSGLPKPSRFQDFKNSLPSFRLPFSSKSSYATPVKGKDVFQFTTDVKNEPAVNKQSVKRDINAVRADMAKYGAKTGTSVGADKSKQ